METRQRLVEALSRRYDPTAKLLDLSALGNDSALVQMGTFNSASTTSKLFPVLMVICDQIFPDAQRKREGIQSVVLANNELRNVSAVTSLAQTFPDLKNLDLSNNKIEHTTALSGWRWRFRFLEHLVLTGNPIEKVEPGYKNDMARWYPSLRILNGVQVRREQDVAGLAHAQRQVANGKTPLPVAPAVFQDEGFTAETFLKDFLPGFDGDRSGLVDRFYDERSTFSYNVNTAAPRAAPTTNQPGGAGDDRKPQMWDAYIRGSRNLTKVAHVSARMSRAHTGKEDIRRCWNGLPATRHPSLFDESQKWLVECHPVVGLPDPTRTFPAGVGGLMVIVHGEFDEINVGTGQTAIRRSFDRTFVLGPGGPNGVRVTNDLLTYRAYGGYDAWVPEGANGAPGVGTTSGPPGPSQQIQPLQVQSQQTQPLQVQPQPIQPLQIDDGHLARLQIPDGMGVAGDGKSPEQLQKEVMVIEMSKRTGMTLAYSKLCLDETSYGFEAAIAAFEAAKVRSPIPGPSQLLLTLGRRAAEVGLTTRSTGNSTSGRIPVLVD